MVTRASTETSRPMPRDPLVFELGKRADTKNPFTMGVTVGRLSTNDVVISDASVSRFHAWFQEERGEWWLTDADSKHGTTVDGRTLKPKERVKLHDGSAVLLGTVSLKFHLREGFVALLDALSKRR